MKVLLLSCNTGEGHHSAALAVEAELQSRNIPCQMVDPMSFASDATRDRVCNAYNSLIRNLPKAFGLIYKAGERADGLWPIRRSIWPIPFMRISCWPTFGKISLTR